jgi:hypothetical protein
MFSLIYVSSAIEPFSEADLVDLLARSRRNNTLLDVTGMLLYKDGNFMQVLEGEQQTVQALYRKIEKDPRHARISRLLGGFTPRREFADWSMGFCNLNSDDARNFPGYNSFLNTPLNGQEFTENPGRCQKLLMSFKKQMCVA